MKTIFLLAAVAWTGSAAAQVAEVRSVFGSGGGPAVGGVYALTDTTGQFSVGTSSSTTYAMADGFWPEPGDPPTAAAFNLGVQSGHTATIALAKLLLRCSDPNGESLQVLFTDSASAQGGTVALGGSRIDYTPPTGFTGADSFNYVIADAGGDTASGSVAVTVTVATSGGSYNHLALESVGGGNVRISFLGIPGRNYAMEVTHDLTPPVSWTPLVTNTAATNGVLVCTNTPGNGQNYYRTRYVP